MAILCVTFALLAAYSALIYVFNRTLVDLIGYFLASFLSVTYSLSFVSLAVQIHKLERVRHLLRTYSKVDGDLMWTLMQRTGTQRYLIEEYKELLRVRPFAIQITRMQGNQAKETV